MAEDSSDDRLAHLGDDNLESAQMGTSHTGASRGGEDVTVDSELGLQTVDELAEQGATVVDLAGEQQFWRFGHVIVDEAQELSPMQWRMIGRRTQGGSITVVGDVAQRSAGPVQSWEELVGDSLGSFTEMELTINYRSPREVNQIASAILADIAPELEPAESIRSSGFVPDAVDLNNVDLDDLVAEERVAVGEGTVAVLGLDPAQIADSIEDTSDVSILSPVECKGLEFDSVIVVEPADVYAASPSGLYVACTRSTNRLRLAGRKRLPGFLVAVVPGSSAVGSTTTRLTPPSS